MTHRVDQIADRIVALLLDETAAQDRVYRDREPVLDVRSELPAVVVHIGADDPPNVQVHGRWRSSLVVHIDLFAIADEDAVSRALLALRTETYKLLMADLTLGLPFVISALPNGAEEILRGDFSLPVGYLRTTFSILYQHSLTDPTGD